MMVSEGRLEVGGEEGKIKIEAEIKVEGKAEVKVEGERPTAENLYRFIAIAAPYLELIEEMTLREFLQFHSRFKPLLSGITIENIITQLGLEKSAGKQLRNYSSGMKQRVKLAQAIFSDVPFILLDEPCTNLDKAGIDLYHQLISTYTTGRAVIVSSNDTVEYDFCQTQLHILDYK
jgi:ABC-type multidrug transport system ATPase subunit